MAVRRVVGLIPQGLDHPNVNRLRLPGAEDPRKRCMTYHLRPLVDEASGGHRAHANGDIGWPRRFNVLCGIYRIPLAALF